MFAEWETTLQYIAVFSIGLVCSTFYRYLNYLFSMDASASQKKIPCICISGDTSTCTLLLTANVYQIAKCGGKTVYLIFSFILDRLSSRDSLHTRALRTWSKT